MQLTIRLAKPGEYRKILELYKRKTLPGKVKKIRQEVIKDFEEMAGGKRVILLAELAGKVVGTGQLVFQLEDKELANGKSVANLHHLRVAERFRGKGIGRGIERALVLEAKKRGFKKITLSVEHDRSSKFLEELYKKWGYVFLKKGAGRKTDFYKEI